MAAGSSSITVFLRAPHPQALAQLATAQGLNRTQRLDALADLVPSEATRTQVADALRTQGYTITGATSWSITATGSSATSARLFGTNAKGAQARALPRLPAALDSQVTAAFPTTGGAPVFRPRTGYLKGTDWRNAYTPATVTPSSGLNSAGATIATLQLANFADATLQPDPKASDLTAYATKYGLTDPVASGQYKAVKVDGGAEGTDGYDEVNLDQQSILSTAPKANQHAYFAPNTTAGYNDVFAQVYDDVVGTKYAKLPDKHLMALSVSWGDCESSTGASGILSLEPILQSLAAAGVTVFAASGDGGIYDCVDASGNSLPFADVDFPASSPYVVAVGGTYLHAATSKPNTGGNWTESAWPCTDLADCSGGGTGGGASGSGYAPGAGAEGWGGFPAPNYQKVGIDTAPFARNAKRLVPDIAAAGDPRSGFVTVHDKTTAAWGGTSLAAPISAAQFVNALAERGRTTGVGDIHGALYSAYRITRNYPATSRYKTFRDVTVGRNGAKVDQSTDPSTYAYQGYDTVSGLGAPLWSALVPYLTDTRTPTVTAVSIAAGTGASWRKVTARWSVSRGSDTSIVGANSVWIYKLGTAKPVWLARTPATSTTFTATPGATYLVKVLARDLSGRTGNTRTATVRVPLDDTVMPHRASDGWVRQTGVRDVAGSNIYVNRKGATATATALGSSFSLRYRSGPTSGKLAVYLNGRLVHTINQRTGEYRIVTTRFYAGPRAKRTFTFKAVSASTVHLDALYATY